MPVLEGEAELWPHGVMGFMDCFSLFTMTSLASQRDETISNSW